MHESAHATAPRASSTAAADAPWRRPFLTTHLAVAASTREFARLATEVASRLEGLALVDPAHAPRIRRSPYRTIVQLGPVAVTLTWLRDRAESTAAGQLLVVVWRGAIAGSGVHQFERRSRIAVATARAVWEGEYTPEAESEVSWRWRPQAADADAMSSATLAERCVAELAREYAASSPVAPTAG